MQNELNKRTFMAGGLSAAATAITPPTTAITGAGSTFAAPILSKWVADYAAQRPIGGSAKITYQAVGSGAGIELIKARKVDFGASDKPLQPADLAQAGLAQFPIVIGGVVPVVNLQGVAPGKLRFTGALLADIYLGKIKRWNDPAIGRLNPGVTLPASEIVVVHRSDGSGTTFNWANYLSKVSPEWRAKVGEGTSLSWPTGVGVSGNDGVAAKVRDTPSAIGYVEFTYITKHNLTWAQLQNRAGKFVTPNGRSFQAASQGVNWRAAQDFYVILTDSPAPDAYPIAATTFILVPRKQSDHTRIRALLRVFEWALEHGQASASNLGYVPLPQTLARLVEAYWLTKIEQ
jgi:phosphate transport system substrate-binding protein